jgi:hypothetical protein
VAQDIGPEFNSWYWGKKIVLEARRMELRIQGVSFLGWKLESGFISKKENFL